MVAGFLIGTEVISINHCSHGRRGRLAIRRLGSIAETNGMRSSEMETRMKAMPALAGKLPSEQLGQCQTMEFYFFSMLVFPATVRKTYYHILSDTHSLYKVSAMLVLLKLVTERCLKDADSRPPPEAL